MSSTLLSRVCSNPDITCVVMSLLGVILIARPQFLFGHNSAGTEAGVADDNATIPVEKGTSAERLVAVG